MPPPATPIAPVAPLGRVLIIAGSDSGGGAGIQADIKSVTAQGAFAMTAITALTVQDTTAVHDVIPIPVASVRDQWRVCLADLGADAIKTGLLGRAELIEALADDLHDRAPDVPRIIDPVMVASTGARLIDDRGVQAMRASLVDGASLVTPNAPEAEVLTGRAVETVDDQRRAAERLLRAGARAALVKGAHVAGDWIVDVLQTEDDEHLFDNPRISSRATHGTGCTLASASAAWVAQGKPIPEAVEMALAYLREAIVRAPGYGRGHAPVDHAWPFRAARSRDQ